MADNLSPSQRSYCMTQVRTKNTDIERLITKELRRRKLRFRKNDPTLPGKPDIVFSDAKLAIFVDGNFWHGYRFSTWRGRISPFWQKKILKNRQRDQNNFRKLRRRGWRTIRLWQTQIQRDLDGCINKILTHVTVPTKS